jgi:hypothetical protein
MPNYAGVFQESIDIAFRESSNFIHIKRMKCSAKVLSFTKNGQPGQASLKSF